MTEEDKRIARDWYKENRADINRRIVPRGPQHEPTGDLVDRPDLWTSEHWRWFLVGEVAKQIGVKV